MLFYLITFGILLFYLVLSWFVGLWAGLAGSDVWLLRILLTLLGLAGAGVALWFNWRHQKQYESSEDSGAGDAVGLLLHEATQRLRGSNLGRRYSLRSLPLFFVLGDGGSGKTASVLNSGLDPELLSGNTYLGNDIAPTRFANVFYTRDAVFLDSSIHLLSDTQQWLKLVNRLRSGRLKATVSKGGQAPRAAIVCVDCPAFTQPDARNTLTALGRKLNARLLEISREMGISFPVYVLFTKLDQVQFPYFERYAGSLTREEAAQVVGATLDQTPAAASTVYEQDASLLMRQAFDELVFSLGTNRLELLAREADPVKQADIYEFPRELRKLRDLLVQFMVDLARPSQLNVNPFLRGFYFSGVRPVTVENAASAWRPPIVQESSGSATRMLTHRDMQRQKRGGASAAASSSRVHQWTFLTRLFSEVLLRDQSALGTSAASSHVSFLRRALVCTALGIFLIAACGFTWSFLANRSLERRVIEAAGSPSQPWDLHRLDRLRQVLEPIADCGDSADVPMGRRWGLYIGHDVYERGRRVYLQGLRQVLLTGTQFKLVGYLNGLTVPLKTTDEYSPAYAALKAYLTTTSHPTESTKDLVAVLEKFSPPVAESDPELIRSQYEFYTSGLPCDAATGEHADVIINARAHLHAFSGEEQLYNTLLAATAKSFSPLNFNRLYPASGATVVDGFTVPAAYVKDAWKAMQTNIEQVNLGGDIWVLGQSDASSRLNLAELRPKFRARYQKEFIDAWRNYIKAARVEPFNGIRDASAKLTTLSSNQSPLLLLFGVLSKNVDVGAKDVSDAFQAPQTVVPLGNLDKPVGPTNQAYMTALADLQSKVQQVANSPGGNDREALDKARAAADIAHGTVTQLAQGSFAIDSGAALHTFSQSLLDEPIKSADRVLADQGPAEINAAGRALCSDFSKIATRFPLNANSGQLASIADFNAFFAPGGELSQFIYQRLQGRVQRQGSGFAPVPGSGVNFNPEFLTFLGKAQEFSDAVYPSGSLQPRFKFTVSVPQVEGVQRLTLNITGETLEANGSAKQFTWDGSDQTEVFGLLDDRLRFLSRRGPWAVFQFFGDMKHTRSLGGTTQRFESTLMAGQEPITKADGTPVVVYFDVNVPAAPLLFDSQYLRQLQCVAQVANH